MALFKEKETKEEKAARKEREMLEKYGLQTLSNSEDIQSVRKIVSELSGTGLIELGATLSGDAKSLSQVQTYYQRAILEQNFIMIRQLDRIASLLEKQNP